MKKIYRPILNEINKSKLLKKNELKHIMGGYKYACWMRDVSTDTLLMVWECNRDPTWCEEACDYDSMGRAYCICIS